MLYEVITLPIMAGVEPLALVRVESPAGRKTFSRKDLKVADMVSEFASGALQSVLRYRSFEQRSLRVTQDGAYNMAFFGDYLSRELHKASVITSYSIHYTKLYDQKFRAETDEAAGRNDEFQTVDPFSYNFV